jgi:hypothetical protein
MEKSMEFLGSSRCANGGRERERALVSLMSSEPLEKKK